MRHDITDPGRLFRSGYVKEVQDLFIPNFKITDRQEWAYLNQGIDAMLVWLNTDIGFVLYDLNRQISNKIRLW